VFKHSMDFLKQFNLSNDEVIGGLEYVALLKENPANAAKKAIEVALARGANLRDIVNDELVPNVTLGATQRLIDERLSGLRNQQQAQNVEPQEVQAARVKTQQFLADYPDAEQHSEVVAHQMRNILQGYQPARCAARSLRRSRDGLECYPGLCCKKSVRC
jgi:hypothetical protein